MPKALVIDSWPGVRTVAASGIGSTLFKLAAFADAFDAGWEIDYLTTKDKASLLANSPVIQELRTSSVGLSLSAYKRVVCLGIEGKPPDLSHRELTYFSKDDLSRYKKEPHLLYWRSFLSTSLGYSQPNTAAEFPLFSNAAPPDGAESPLSSSCRRIGIAPTVVSHLKEYHNWNVVIDLLLKGSPDAHLVILGSGQFEFSAHSQVRNLVGKTETQELIELIRQCSVIIGCDGLITNLAMVLGVPAVVLFSIIAPSQVIDPNQSSRSQVVSLVHGECPLQFCYPFLEDYRVTPCPYEPTLPRSHMVHCMRFFPERIVDAAIKLLESGNSKL